MKVRKFFESFYTYDELVDKFHGGKRSRSYVIQYENVPVETLGFVNGKRSMFFDEIKFISKVRKKLELILISRKYNL